jgi:hypothetical protein
VGYEVRRYDGREEKEEGVVVEKKRGGRKEIPRSALEAVVRRPPQGRLAVNGIFASTAIHLPPGRLSRRPAPR